MNAESRETYTVYDGEYKYPAPYYFCSNFDVYVRIPQNPSVANALDPNVLFPMFVTKIVKTGEIKYA